MQHNICSLDDLDNLLNLEMKFIEILVKVSQVFRMQYSDWMEYEKKIYFLTSVQLSTISKSSQNI